MTNLDTDGSVATLFEFYFMRHSSTAQYKCDLSAANMAFPGNINIRKFENIGQTECTCVCVKPNVKLKL